MHSKSYSMIPAIGRLPSLAQPFLWSHADNLGIDSRLLRTSGAHIHMPAGAVPKDGPSAGVAMVTALASAYSRLPVRNDTAMTGPVTSLIAFSVAVVGSRPW